MSTMHEIASERRKLNEIAGNTCRRLNPSNPELVAGGIEEMVGLLARMIKRFEPGSEPAEPLSNILRPARALLKRIGVEVR